MIEQGQPRKKEKESKKMTDVIYFFGPSHPFYKFIPRTRDWLNLRFDHKSSYKGNLKHQSCVAMPDDQKIIVTGGVSIATCQPVGNVFLFLMKTLEKGASIGMKNMIHKRYAHSSVYIREKVLVFGGFSHADIPEEPP